MSEHLHYASVSIPNTWVVLSFVVMTLGIVFCLSLRKRSDARNSMLLCLLAEYFFLVLCATVFCRPDAGAHKMNLLLFNRYLELFTTNNEHLKHEIITEALMNILMFVPIGALASNLKFGNSKGGWIRIIVVGMILSCTVESLQYVLDRGVCETNDIFHNTVGAILGYFVCELFLRKKENV